MRCSVYQIRAVDAGSREPIKRRIFWEHAQGPVTLDQEFVGFVVENKLTMIARGVSQGVIAGSELLSRKREGAEIENQPAFFSNLIS